MKLERLLPESFKKYDVFKKNIEEKRAASANNLVAVAVRRKYQCA